MVLEYPATELYILFAVSITFLGGVVLSESVDFSGIHMVIPGLFVMASWGNIAVVLGLQCWGMESFPFGISLEMGLHCLALLLFLLSFFLVLPAVEGRTAEVFLNEDEAE